MFNQDETRNKVTARWTKLNQKPTSKTIRRENLNETQQAQFDAFIALTYYAMNATVNANPFFVSFEGMIAYVNYDIIQVAISEPTEEQIAIVTDFVTNVFGITGGL